MSNIHASCPREYRSARISGPSSNAKGARTRADMRAVSCSSLRCPVSWTANGSVASARRLRRGRPSRSTIADASASCARSASMHADCSASGSSGPLKRRHRGMLYAKPSGRAACSIHRPCWPSDNGGSQASAFCSFRRKSARERSPRWKAINSSRTVMAPLLPR